MKVSVDASALASVLAALNGPSHYIRELQATRSLSGNPINMLVDEFNDWVSKNDSADNERE